MMPDTAIIIREGQPFPGIQPSYSCADLGVCQSRRSACVGCSAHHFPKPMQLAPGVIDFGARRSSLEWLLANRAYAAFALLKALLIGGSITFTCVLLAAKWGWL